MKNERTIVIGISSGIAGYKILDLIDLLKKEGLNIFVIMTNHAVGMFGKSAYELKSGNKVFTEIIPSGFDYHEILQKRDIEHIKLAGRCDLLLIAPATANVIGKLASGIADDYLTTIALAVSSKTVICPSMNPYMWDNPAVQENISRLKQRGYIVIDPDYGDLACGYKGTGRLKSPQKIKEEILLLLQKRISLKGKKVLITGGASIEPIDGVRIITNRGTGKMGREIATECVNRGAEVLYLKARSSMVTGIWQKELLFETTAELYVLLKKYVPDYDYVYHSASVSDFTPEKRTEGKKDSGSAFTLRLIPTEKIINSIKVWNPKIKLIGFKAFYNTSLKKLKKTVRKIIMDSKADFVVVNDVGKKGIGFGSENNEIFFFSEKGIVVKVKKAPKKAIAEKIIDYSSGVPVSTISPGFSQ